MFVGVIDLGSQKLMMPGSSFASWKSTGAGTGGIPDQFPAGLRVLVVDDDPTCLMILEKMLRNCNYEVTKCNRAETALSFLRENMNGFDIVISDVHMPDMDGFKLLEHIGLEMDLPVIMMSADDSNSVVMKGITHGAYDYLIKPVRIEALRNIWQHVVRRRKHEWKDFEPSAGADDADRQQKVPEELDYSSSANEGHNWKNAKKRKDDEDEAEERDESSSLKKPRVVWSVELHQQFVAAVNQLGIDKAVPKKILDLMNVPRLTRENVASHLQKYRLYLRRLSGSLHPGSINTSFVGNPDAGWLDLQALAAGGQHQAQSLVTHQAVALGRSNNSKSPISVPVIDQRNKFSFENSKSRYGEVKSQHLNMEPTQMNLLHGIPTNMELRQLVGLQHSFGGVNSQVVIPMAAQTQSQVESDSNHHHVPRQPILPNGMLTHGLETKVLRGRIITNFDVFNHLNQSRPHDWGVQAIHNASSYSSGKKMGPTAIFSAGEDSGTNRNGFGDNRMRAKAESVTLHREQYDQDDLLTAVLKQQQQEGFGQPENEFGFDGYALDNLPV